ncbi:hypothetical protein TIFTF001_020313 [Ficus carica]|uniref:C-JID domain-containing protein n=1 Tax=Ficus carica TaxID=3494 RepID=A0AA88AFF2_FICCA|nr:hypothetical protein TIFTF001_020313 [Ficus carica]
MQNLVFLKIVDGELHKLHYFPQDIWSLPPALRYLDHKVFENINNLGFNTSADEVSHKLHFPQDIKSLPTALRYLEWWNYPLKSLPSNFVPQNIVELKMPHNKLKKLWSGVQNLGNLKHIDLSFSYRLSQIPELSCAPKLESIILESCWSLNSVPPLKFLIVDEHTRSAEPWNFEHGRKHGTLNFDGCSGLKSLPNITGNIKYIKLCSTAVKELPSSISSLENLISLDLSNCELKNLPSFKYLYRLIELRISDCKNLQSLPELPLSLRLLDACRCTSLKTVSNSISRQVEGCWNDNQVTPDTEFLFGNCSKLDQTARTQIMTQSRIKILHTATISVSQSEEMSRVFCGKPSVSCCFPGNKIPYWFSKQDERSLITIKLPPNWHNNNFLGFALCVVSKFSYPTSLASSRFSSMLSPLKRAYTAYHFEVKCEILFRSNRGETSPKFLCPFQDESSGRRRSFVRSLSSSHVLMWYKYEDYHEYLDATEVSFEFQVLFNKPGVFYYCDDYIRRCGIRFLYLQDADAETNGHL